MRPGLPAVHGPAIGARQLPPGHAVVLGWEAYGIHLALAIAPGVVRWMRDIATMQTLFEGLIRDGQLIGKALQPVTISNRDSVNALHDITGLKFGFRSR